MVAQVVVGLIGFGTLGQGLASAIATGLAGNTALGAVLVRPSGVEAALASLDQIGLRPVLTADPDRFFEANTTLIVEAAGQEALRLYAARALELQRDLLVCATGAFTDDVLFNRLSLLAGQAGRRLIIPSGAIAGIDALASAAIAGLDEVCIVTRKPPRAWLGTAAEDLVDLDNVREEAYCLFEGSAREAARLFPQNVNVAATLACAGIGLDRTRARVYADPTISRNLHQIQIKGSCGQISIEVCGLPSPGNPRTSALTAYSLIKTVRNLTSPVVIG
ncbi:MAG TPA: aspartate dehydrogenase [Chloroflexia bacterium]|nr:aspartate dehydrogenase [Chloroflexia bacterium]